MRTKPDVVAMIAFRTSFFDWVTGGVDCLCESKLWNHDRIQTMALGGERIGEDDGVKSFFSLLTNWSTVVCKSAAAADSEIESSDGLNRDKTSKSRVEAIPGRPHVYEAEAQFHSAQMSSCHR